VYFIELALKNHTRPCHFPVDSKQLVTLVFVRV